MNTKFLIKRYNLDFSSFYDNAITFLVNLFLAHKIYFDLKIVRLRVLCFFFFFFVSSGWFGLCYIANNMYEGEFVTSMLYIQTNGFHAVCGMSTTFRHFTIYFLFRCHLYKATLQQQERKMLFFFFLFSMFL